MITDYTVISSIDTANLTEAVYEMIQDGWQPLGGVVLAYERNIHRKMGQHDKNLPNDFQHYAQAMVKVAV